MRINKKEDIIKNLESIKETVRGNKEAEQIIDNIMSSIERTKKMKKTNKKSK